MTATKRVSSGSPFEGILGMSRARRIGSTIAVAGTAPLGPDGKTVGVGDLYAQTRRCLAIIEQALADAGASLDDVIRTRVMLVDISSWRDAARAHGEVFGEIRPACTVVEVKGFIDPDWLVELEVDAVTSR
jgi:enamine deaminase RidA (YjgF/YER057c/UK114 family)